MLVLHREAVACDCHHVCDQRHVLLYCLIHCERCCNVLNHSSHVDRKTHRLHLTLHHCIDKLLLTTLRVLLLESHHRNAVITLGSLLKFSDCSSHGLDSLRLVLLDTDDSRTSAENLLHDSGSDNDFLASLEHDAIVRSKIRLTLRSVKDKAISLLAWRRTKLHMCRECRTAESHDTVHLDLLKNLLVVLWDRCHESVCEVNALCPLVTLHIDLDVSHIVTGEVLARSDRLHCT